MRSLNKTTTNGSPEVAYAIGLLATDGCVSKDKRHIDFTSKDRELVDSFKKCLSLSVKVGKKRNGLKKDKKYYRVQFGDVNFYRWLLKIGLTTRKSKTLSALKIPDKYFFDFLRGCFDGDGTIYSYWDSRWASSFMFYMVFCSGSKCFLEWIQEKTIELLSIKGNITVGGSIFLLKYAKRESLILFEHLFYADNIPYLLRKYQKAKKIFNIEKDHNTSARVL